MKRAAIIVGFLLVLSLAALLPLQRSSAPAPALPSPQQLAQTAPISSPLPQPSLQLAAPSPQTNEPNERRETRALWVVRHTMTSPEAIHSLVKRAKENGFTDLIVQVRGRGDAYYNSRLEPRAEDLANQPSDFDPLAMVIDDAHLVGIKVHAWLNIFLVANIETLPAAKDHVIFKHPEWIMAPRGVAAEIYNVDPHSPAYLNRIVEYTRSNRKELEGLFVSPANPEVTDNMFNIWMDVATKYEVDGLHFDYVRYPNPQFDYSRTSIDRFREEIEPGLSATDRAAMAAKFTNDPLVYAANFPDRYAQFQRRQVTELVARIYKGVKQVKPYVIISAAVFANDQDAARSRYQDWKTWLRQGWLDAICPMAYTPENSAFRAQIANAMSHAAGKQVWGGIGAYRQKAEGALEKIRLTRELGAQGFVLFSYDSSIQVSPLNPQGTYLEKLHEAWKPLPSSLLHHN